MGMQILLGLRGEVHGENAFCARFGFRFDAARFFPMLLTKKYLQSVGLRGEDIGDQVGRLPFRVSALLRSPFRSIVLRNAPTRFYFGCIVHTILLCRCVPLCLVFESVRSPCCCVKKC